MSSITISKLLDPPQPPTRNGSPETSYEAAESVDVSRMQQLVLKALTRLGNDYPNPVEAWMVQREVESILQHPIAGSTVRTRLNELVNRGLVVIADHEGLSVTAHRCARYALAELEKAA
ncbi:hypothetical protein [Bifidobacterium mongoliense]|uniref:Uncharacterized protein n=1 Tax=Bifidobacterium mongoliense TaxID=518643 RepID=A0A423UE30_9BIFI|nr:hypothetical protein [Bifidobacterium mongoliense]ROT86971.1 hypothetical protein BMONG18_0970 [Bifidobacterium mongoliense]